MEDWEKQVFDAQEAAGIHRKIGAFFLEFCVPAYWWIPGPNGAPTVLHNGTAFFVDTGKARFGVTCHHVLKGMRKARAALPNVTCQMGNDPCDTIDDHLISDDEHLDLATFHISQRITALSCPRWPPAQMKPGDDYILGGFPGYLRRPEDHTEFSVGLVTFQFKIENASENHVSLRVDSEERYFPGKTKLEPFVDLGGMSGGPIMRRRSKKHLGLELGGVIYEAQDDAFEIIRGRQMSLIDAYGRISSTP